MAPAGRSVLARVPVVGSLAYAEQLRQLPPSFTAELAPERENRYFRHAIAVLAKGTKVGYVAPEVAPHYYDALVARQGPPVTCPCRRADPSDRASSGVELLLDLNGVDVTRSG